MNKPTKESSMDWMTKLEIWIGCFLIGNGILLSFFILLALFLKGMKE